MQKPLCFIENKGQVLDQNNHSRTDVQFKLSGRGVSLFVGNGQLHYQFKKVTEGAKSPEITTYQMDVTLLGADQHAQVKESEKIDYQENYYIPQSGPQGFHASAYRKITYTNVYPNIDWVIYVKNDKVEYDFVVREGGDVKNIQLQYGGATDLSINAQGGILARTPMGDVTEKQPYAYENATGKKVASRFALNGNVVSFETGKHNGAFTIDPFLQWSTYFGGTSEDVATGVKTSASGAVYICGYTATSGLPTGTAPATTYGGGTYDAFITRYSTAGVFAWTTYVGGEGDDRAMAMYINAAGIYMAGSTTSSLVSIAAGAAPYQSFNGGGSDIMLASIGGGGGITWATYLGGVGDEKGYSVTADLSGNIYVGGSTQSAGLGTDLTDLQGTTDGILAKFSSAGVNQFVTYFGGPGDDEIRSVALNTTTATAFVAVTGTTNSVFGIASTPAYQSALGGTSDAFLARYATTTAFPSIAWSTYIGGSSDDIGNSVASDALNNIYVTGNTSSNDAIVSGLSYTSNYGGLQDGYLMKFDVTGAKKWGTYIGGSDSDYAQGVVVDAIGAIAVAGGTKSTGIASTGAYQAALSGTADAFVTKYNTLGQRNYLTYFGKTGNDMANGIAVDATATAGATNSIVIGGRTTSPTGSGFATTGAASTTNNGNTEAFASKFARDTIVSFRQPFTDTLMCPGTTFVVHDTVNYNFFTGNVFKVQLSDASGSFAAPVQIGTSTTITFGAINCTIPAGTVAGTGYRIRIVSTLPVTTSVDDYKDINIVTTLPSTVVTATSPVCVGQTINFTASAGYSVNSYSWAGPAGFSSAAQNPSITGATVANGGTYSVTVTHANNCPVFVNTVVVLVNSFIPPTPIDSANSPLCAGSTLQLFARPNYPTGIFSYHWSGPGGFTSTMQNPVIPGISTADTGFYYVVDTLDACPSLKDSIHIVINPTLVPGITITVTPNDTVCSGTTFHFHASNTNGGFSPQYQWMTSPTTPIVGAIFDNYSSATLASGTPISCVMTSNIACPSVPTVTSNVIVVTVLNNTPVVSIIVSDSTVVSGTVVTLTAFASGPSMVSYQWYVDGVAVSGATGSTFVDTVMHTEAIRYEVISSGLCASLGVSNTITIHVPNSIGTVSPEFMNIDLFPNPNNGSFAIKGSIDGINDGNVDLQATNVVGQTIYRGKAAITNGQLETSIQLPDMPAGIYLLHISKDGAQKTFRFVVN